MAKAEHTSMRTAGDDGAWSTDVCDLNMSRRQRFQSAASKRAAERVLIELISDNVSRHGADRNVAADITWSKRVHIQWPNALCERLVGTVTGEWRKRASDLAYLLRN
jgi:hypothetical protein